MRAFLKAYRTCYVMKTELLENLSKIEHSLNVFGANVLKKSIFLLLSFPAIQFIHELVVASRHMEKLKMFLTTSVFNLRLPNSFEKICDSLNYERS